MPFAVKPKSPISDDSVSDNAKSTQSTKSNTICNDTEPGTSYEVFRNSRTAVEVIVKEVTSKNSKKKIVLDRTNSLQTIRKLHEEVENLKCELERTNSQLSKVKKGFRMIIFEMKKQLDSVSRQELEWQKETLVLQIENEKLKTLLESKTSLITKFKREFNTMKRLLKVVTKNIILAPYINESLVLTSDPEFDDFEKDLKRDIRVTFAKNLDCSGAFDSSILSKDTKDSFEKHF